MGEWIKCKDRLPQFDVPVLLYLKSKLKSLDDVITDGIVRGNLRYGTDNHDFYTRFYNDSFYEAVYWTPLPNPPKD